MPSFTGKKVLLVTNHHSGKFYLPAGGIESGERITEGLRREVKEETGLDLGHERFLYFAGTSFTMIRVIKPIMACCSTMPARPKHLP